MISVTVLVPEAMNTAQVGLDLETVLEVGAVAEEAVSTLEVTQEVQAALKFVKVQAILE